MASKSQGFTCFCLVSARIKGGRHHAWPCCLFLSSPLSLILPRQRRGSFREASGSALLPWPCMGFKWFWDGCQATATAVSEPLNPPRMLSSSRRVLHELLSLILPTSPHLWDRVPAVPLHCALCLTTGVCKLGAGRKWRAHPRV